MSGTAYPTVIKLIRVHVQHHISPFSVELFKNLFSMKLGERPHITSSCDRQSLISPMQDRQRKFHDLFSIGEII